MKRNPFCFATEPMFLEPTWNKVEKKDTCFDFSAKWFDSSDSAARFSSLRWSEWFAASSRTSRFGHFSYQCQMLRSSFTLKTRNSSTMWQVGKTILSSVVQWSIKTVFQTVRFTTNDIKFRNNQQFNVYLPQTWIMKHLIKLPTRMVPHLATIIMVIIVSD